MAEDANIRVVVNAITEAAEQGLEDVGDEISGLADDTAVGQTALDQLSGEMSQGTRNAAVLMSALDELSDETSDVARNALIAQTAMDQLSDEMQETSQNAGMAAGSLGVFGASAGSASAGMYALSVAMKLSLIPAILTLSTVLAPVLVTFGALASGAIALGGALAAIVGSGILAFGQQKAEQNQQELEQTNRLIKQYESLQEQTGSLSAQEQTRLDQLREKQKRLEDTTTATGALQQQMGELGDEIRPMIVEFGQEFVPLVEDGIDALPTLVENMIASVGSTEEFKEALRDWGELGMEVIPGLTGLFFDLGRAALPVARDFVQFLQNNGDQALQDMQESVNELAPEFSNLLDALIDAGPTLLEFGTNVGETVIPALTDLINAADGAMEWFNDLDSSTQDLIVKALLLAPVLLKVAGAVGTLSNLLGGGSGAGLVNLLARVAGVLGGGGAAGGAAATAGVYGAAMLAGAGLGVITVKALEAVGALDRLEEAGKGVRDELGGQQSDSMLASINRVTGGGFEEFTQVGAGVRGLVDPNSTIAQERQEVENVFDNAMTNTVTAGDSATTPAGAPEISNRRDAMLAQAEQYRARYGEGQGETNVDVTYNTRNTVNENPYRHSRKLARQLLRELRVDMGASQGSGN